MSAIQHFARATASRLCVLLAATALAPAAAAQSDVAVDKFWVTDGGVAAIAQDAARVYLGGKFGRVAPRSGSSVRIDAASGLAAPPFPYVRGVVHAVVPDGSGGWFLGGAFDKVGDIFRNNVVHVLADGRLSNWQANVNGPVYALAREGGFVYIGGAFTQISGTPHNLLGRVDTAYGGPDVWDPNVTGSDVRALALSGGVVYFGGTFGFINGALPRNNAAAVLVADASATPWDPNTDGTVRALAVAPPSFYLGGDFTFVNGTARNRLALVDGTGVLQGAWNPNPDASVHALALGSGGAPLYAGGAFATIGGAARLRLAAINPAGAALATFNANADGTVEALAWSPFGLYVGGAFTNVAGAPRYHLACVDVASGTPLSWDPHAFGPVEALAYDPRPSGPDWIYAGGSFAAVNGDPRRNLAAFVKTSGAVDGTWLPEPDGPVHALRAVPPRLYVGGEFANIGGQPRNSLAMVDDAAGAALPWNPDVTGGTPSAVRTMDFDLGASVVYVGGDFTTVNGGTARRNAAAFDLASGGAMLWDPGPDATVRQLAVFPALARVDLAGDFLQINLPLVPRAYFASVDFLLGAVSLFTANTNAPVYAFFPLTPDIHLAGAFSTLGTPTQPRSLAGAVDTLLGAANGWDPNVTGPLVRSLVQDSAATAMLGGSFTAVAGVGRNNLAQVSVLAPGAPTAWNPDANGGDVNTILPTPPMVFVGGDFRFASRRPQRGFAAFCKAATVTGVTAAPFGPNAIQVFWTDSGAPRYNVYRSESGLPFVLIGTAMAPSVSLIDFDVEGGPNYAYIVRAEEGDCESDPSTAAFATTTGACGSPPVFDGAADALQPALAACQVQVTWNDALGRCGETPVFNVYRGDTPTFVPDATRLIAQGLTSHGWTDTTDLAPSLTYYYVVRAFDPSVGEEDANLIRVGITLSPGCTAGLPPGVEVLTARARAGENRLEWVYPLGFGTLDLRYNQSTLPDSPCTPPPDTASGTSLGLFSGTPGAAASADHTAAANDHNFCYSAFVLGGSPSLGVSVAARPAAVPAAVSWVYTSGAAALSRPGVIPQRAYLGTSNDRRLHAMTPSPTGGAWPSLPMQWMPPTLNAAALGRPTVVALPTTTVAGASRIALVGAQDGRVYCFNADSGALLWVSNGGGTPLGEGIVAPPSVLVQDFGPTPANLVLVGTRNAASDNRLIALHLADGSIAWQFDNNGGGPGQGIGIISGQPLVEYGTPPRVYFASRRRAGGSPSTVWAVDVGAAIPSPAWNQDHGEIDGAVTRRGSVLYVGSNESDVRALSRVDGTFNWQLNLGDGPVKGFVWPDGFSNRLYASTTNGVVALADNGGSVTPFWSAPLVAVPNPSTPILIGTTLYIGGGDGRLHAAVANVAGTPPLTTSVPLGDPTVPKVVGAPTFDRGDPTTAADDIVVAGTDEGRFYAVHPPF